MCIRDRGDKLNYINYQWDEASGESKVVIGAYSLTDGSREDLPITINADGGGIYSMQAEDVYKRQILMQMP